MDRCYQTGERQPRRQHRLQNCLLASRPISLPSLERGLCWTEGCTPPSCSPTHPLQLSFLRARVSSSYVLYSIDILPSLLQHFSLATAVHFFLHFFSTLFRISSYLSNFVFPSPSLGSSYSVLINTLLPAAFPALQFLCFNIPVLYRLFCPFPSFQPGRPHLTVTMRRRNCQADNTA